MEEWKIIPGYGGVYEASNLGRIRSLKTGNILTPYVNCKGYCRATLCVNGKCYNVSFHRVVITSFLPNPENMPQINHKNGIKTDNRLCNLEWCSSSYNLKHAFRIGLRKHTFKQIKQISDLGASKRRPVINIESGIYYDSITEAAIAHNINPSCLAERLRSAGKNKTLLRLA